MEIENIQKTFERISKELENVNKKIEGMLPKVLIKNASSFGNSSHVVLSKEFLNKKVGVIVFDKQEEMTQGAKQ